MQVSWCVLWTVLRSTQNVSYRGRCKRVKLSIIDDPDVSLWGKAVVVGGGWTSLHVHSPSMNRGFWWHTHPGHWGAIKETVRQCQVGVFSCFHPVIAGVWECKAMVSPVVLSSVKWNNSEGQRDSTVGRPFASNMAKLSTSYGSPELCQYWSLSTDLGRKPWVLPGVTQILLSSVLPKIKDSPGMFRYWYFTD